MHNIGIECLCVNKDVLLLKIFLLEIARKCVGLVIIGKICLGKSCKTRNVCTTQCNYNLKCMQELCSINTYYVKQKEFPIESAPFGKRYSGEYR